MIPGKVVENKELDLSERWLAHLGDNGYYSSRVANWAEVSRLGVQERMMSEAVFNMVRGHGYRSVLVSFPPDMGHEYRVTREDGRFELEINARYRGRTVSDLLKFVRYCVMGSFGIPYIPDLGCFGDTLCPSAREPHLDQVREYRLFPEETSGRRNIIWTPKGAHRDILDSVRRLLEKGLIEPADIADSRFAWSNELPRERLGWCAIGIGTVFVNCVFDSADVSDQCMDFVVYHECLHLRQRMCQHPLTGDHDTQFREWERRYPRMDSAYREACSSALACLGP